MNKKDQSKGAEPEAERGEMTQQDRLGRTLREIYDGVLAEAVPDEMLDLLNQLDEAPSAGGQSDKRKGVGTG
ncbi:MAG: NepR family anti-sigma factor [Rhodothalassiaceae bacterium]